MSRYVVFFFLFVVACGASQPEGLAVAHEEDLDGPEIRLTAEDMVPRGALARADFTTAVDSKRMRAVAPLATEFEATERVIYLVGRLKNVPADSTIEVHWFLDASPEPLLVSDIQGSENYQFVASFKPAERKFMRGSYTAKVLVNDSVIGTRSFYIRDNEMEENGVRIKNIKLSSKVNRQRKPISPVTRFASGTRKVIVSFDVLGADPEEVVDVTWNRAQENFHAENVALSGDRRYDAHIEASEGLPNGDYSVEITMRNQVFAEKAFSIGVGSQGPVVETVSLGLALRKNNMPDKPRRVFDRDTPVIQCGLRFLDLLPDSEIEVQWIQIDADGEIVRYTTRSRLSAGGSGSMGAAWNPTYELEPGKYKAKVLINGEAFAEEDFRVE